MDDIWNNATRKAHACNKCAATSSIANKIDTTTNTTSLAVTNKNPAISAALTEENMNTVEKIDTQLTHLELNSIRPVP
jgi:hypothetical protein